MSASTAEVAEAVLVWQWARYTRLQPIVAVILLSPPSHYWACPTTSLIRGNVKSMK